MKSLFRYEWHKFLFHKKNRALLFLLVMFLVGFIGVHYQKDQNYPVDMEETMFKNAEIARGNAKMASAASTYLTNEEEIRELEKESDYWNELSGICTLLQADYSNASHHTVSFLRNEADWYRMVIEGRKQGYNVDSITLWSDKTLHEKLSVNQYLIQKKLTPQNSPFECNFFNLINLLCSDYYPLLLTAIFLLMVFDICSSEFENGTYKTLYTTSISRVNILKAKFLFMLTLSVLYILLILFIFQAAGLLFGIGSPDYPYLVNSVISTILKADGYMLLIFFANLLFLIAILVGISYMIHSSSVCLAFVIILYAVVVIYRQVFDFASLYSFIPACYIFNKEIIQYHGTGICLFISIVCAATVLPITGKCFSKQNLNNSQ